MKARYQSFALLCLLVCALSDAAYSQEPIDRQTLRSELAELRSVAQQLTERIQTLEGILNDQNFRLGDIVTIKLPLLSKSSSKEPTDDDTSKEELLKRVAAEIIEITPNGEYRLYGGRRVSNNGIVLEEMITGIAPRNGFDASKSVRADVIRELKYQMIQQPAE